MRLDVIQLKEFYRATELGRTTKQLINRVLETKVDTKNGSFNTMQGKAFFGHTLAECQITPEVLITCMSLRH